MSLSHLKRIKVDVDKLEFAGENHPSWWNWDVYLETWQILDEDPKTPSETLPLFFNIKRFCRRFLDMGRDEAYKRAYQAVEYRRKFYRIMRRQGYNTNYPAETPIRIRIRDDGVIYVGNGHHRVSIIKHLRKPKEIEVRVAGRGDGWVAFKRKVFGIYGRKMLYQPLDHPDFDDWTVSSTSHDTLRLILKETGSIKGKTILDIGCCTGYFGYHLARRGAKVTGVDRNRTRIEIAEHMRRYNGANRRNPLFITTSFEEYLKGAGRFDAALMLNLIHHYMRENLDKAWKATNLISRHTDEMFLQTRIGPLREVGLTPRKMARRIMKNSAFETYKRLKSRVQHKVLYVFR